MLCSTVDGFQGREKDVIIISTVRAAAASGGGDSGSIGFLSDVRRMNVALTRGRHCMLVVGHAQFLAQHDAWRGLVAHTLQEGALVHTDYVCSDRLPPLYGAELLQRIQQASAAGAAGAGSSGGAGASSGAAARGEPDSAAIRDDVRVRSLGSAPNLRGLCPKVAKLLQRRGATSWASVQQVSSSKQ